MSRLALLLLALACAPAPPPADPNLLLLVSDTLRADALECYGGAARTPHVCGLAAQGVLFERAWSNGSWTLPSAVSLFTAQVPPVFAREAGSFEDKNDFYYIGEQEELLAESLRRRGYGALAFVENPMVRKPNALQGFDVVNLDEVVGFDSDLGQRLGIDTSDLRYLRLLPALHFLLGEDGAGDPSPFFALQWFKDPHAAYEPPRWLAATLRIDASRLPRPLADYARMASRADRRFDWLDLNALGPGLSEYEVETLRALYLKEVESVDERVGFLLRALDERGLRERTYVVFTADHGEGFGEHGKFLHSEEWYYEEFVRIPLIVSGPALARGRRVADPVSLVDLMPTLAELAGEAPPGAAQGRSLLPLLRPRREPLEARPQVLVGTARERGYAALLDGRYKLIRRPQGSQLFDLADDPGERRDLAAQRPELAAQLLAKLEALQADAGQRRAARREVDPALLERTQRETREALRALGYAE